MINYIKIEKVRVDKRVRVFYTRNKEGRKKCLEKSRRHYSGAFKPQVVEFYTARQKWSELVKEYELPPSTFDKWIQQSKTSAYFFGPDNVTDERREWIPNKNQKVN